MTDIDVEQMMTRGEVATLLRVHPDTVTRWVKAGRIGKSSEGCRPYRESDVQALLDSTLNLESPTHKLWRRVDTTGGPTACWLWLGSRAGKGYGTVWAEGRHQYVHRLAYELIVGPIAPDLTVDHLCHTKTCVNPAHFELVTRGENGRRGNLKARTYTRASHCKRGHEFTNANVYVDGLGNRSCLTCRRTYRLRLRTGG